MNDSILARLKFGVHFGAGVREMHESLLVPGRFMRVATMGKELIARLPLWIFDRTIGVLKQKVSEAKVKKDQVSENERQELRELLKWNREAERDFDPKTIKAQELGGTQIRTMQISGEPSIAIVFC